MNHHENHGDEQFHQGQELTLHTGLTWEELRCTALLAAASSYAGISTMRDRDTQILQTADRFMDWLMEANGSS